MECRRTIFGVELLPNIIFENNLDAGFSEYVYLNDNPFLSGYTDINYDKDKNECKFIGDMYYLMEHFNYRMNCPIFDLSEYNFDVPWDTVHYKIMNPQMGIHYEMDKKRYLIYFKGRLNKI